MRHREGESKVIIESSVEELAGHICRLGCGFGVSERENRVL